MRHLRIVTWLALLVLATPAAGEVVMLRTARVQLEIEATGGLPSAWTSCAASCDIAGSRQVMIGPGGGAMAWGGAPAAVAAMERIAYTATLSETPEAMVAVMTATGAVAGRRLVQRYELSRTTHAVRMIVQAVPGVGLELRSGAGFVPAPLPGFGAAFADVEPVRVQSSGQDAIEAAQPGGLAINATAGEWIGVRQRFWAWLATPAVPAGASVSVPSAGEPAVYWQTVEGALDLTVYGGPVQWQSLRVVAPELTQMLFAALWEPLRWLCYGLLFLLGFIMRWVDSPGVAIILLSLAVKIILWPLTRIADRWQQEVNRTQSRLQPRIAEIRQSFKGEEAHNLTLQVYRDEGVHPLFTLKSLGGFAIQVPMFIAAFDMLADNFSLSGQRFLWIADLAAPDRFAALPLTLPFFGGDLNLMPAVMTLFTVLSALTQHDTSLTPALLRKQRFQLYLMAVAFFLLFYTFPSGMVLYWTANNFWHFCKIQVLQRLLHAGP